MKNDLFAYARRTDPGTSHDAARSLDEKTAGKLQRIVIDTIGGASDRGMICDEIVSATGLPWNTVSPRLAPLRRKKLITARINPETGRAMTRRGPSGRQQIIWFLK